MAPADAGGRGVRSAPGCRASSVAECGSAPKPASYTGLAGPSRGQTRSRADPPTQAGAAMPRHPHQPGPPDFAILGLLMLGPRHGYELLPYFSRGGELGLVCTLGTPR